MKRNFIILIINCLLISNSNIYSQSLKSVQVNKIVSQFADSTTAGLAIAVIKDGEIIHQKCYGLANIDYKIKVTPSTIFEIASISKQFTAFAILLLEKEGKLSSSDKILKYIPEIPDAYKDITIENLVYHTSGLKEQFDLLRVAGWRRDDIVTQDQVVDLILNQKSLNFKPGEDKWYCNSGYTLLAEIAERVTGQPFSVYMEENIFKPLGMNNTFMHDDNDRIIKNLATSYRPDGFGKFKIEQYNFSNYGALGVYTNILDFAKWDENLYTGVIGGKEVLQKMKQPCKLNNGEVENYGYGIFVGDYKGYKTYSHGGSEAGYYAKYIQFPEEHFSVLVLSNQGLFDRQLHYKIADIYLDLDKKWKVESKDKLADISWFKDEYQGLYFGGIVYTFVKENDKLFVKFRDNYKLELYEKAAGVYYTISPYYEFAFNNDSLGEVKGFTLNNRNNYTKLEETVLAEAKVKEYIGEYYSEELDAFRTVVAKNGLLYFKGRNETDDPLYEFEEDNFYKTNTDEFNAGMVRIVFNRNSRHKVNSFEVRCYATRSIRFNKIENIKYVD